MMLMIEILITIDASIARGWWWCWWFKLMMIDASIARGWWCWDWRLLIIDLSRVMMILRLTVIDNRSLEGDDGDGHPEDHMGDDDDKWGWCYVDNRSLTGYRRGVGFTVEGLHAWGCSAPDDSLRVPSCRPGQHHRWEALIGLLLFLLLPHLGCQNGAVVTIRFSVLGHFCSPAFSCDVSARYIVNRNHFLCWNVCRTHHFSQNMKLRPGPKYDYFTDYAACASPWTNMVKLCNGHTTDGCTMWII